MVNTEWGAGGPALQAATTSPSRAVRTRLTGTGRFFGLPISSNSGWMGIPGWLFFSPRPTVRSESPHPLGGKGITERGVRSQFESDGYTQSRSPRPAIGARVLKTEFGEHLKPRSQYVDEAVQMAIAGRWEEAADLNNFILEKFGPDEETLNRIGKAMSELGKLKEAKQSYEKTLQLNPLNLIAQKNRAKLDVLVQTKGELRRGPAKVDLNLFGEEMGKTVSTTLEDVADPDVHNKVAAGDIAELRIEGDTIVAESVRGARLGLIEPRPARRPSQVIHGGNRYLAAVTSAEPG